MFSSFYIVLNLCGDSQIRKLNFRVKRFKKVHFQLRENVANSKPYKIREVISCPPLLAEVSTPITVYIFASKILFSGVVMVMGTKTTNEPSGAETFSIYLLQYT